MKKTITNLGFAVILVTTLALLYGVLGMKPETAVTQTIKTKVTPVQKVNDVVQSALQSKNFDDVNLFTYGGKRFSQKEITTDIKKAVNLELEPLKLTGFRAGKNINFSIPLSGSENMELQLVEAELLSTDFKAAGRTENGETSVPYKQGRYYRGIVKGEQNSLASISVFDNLVMGVISCAGGTYNLGPVRDAGNTYIFYREEDLIKGNNFKCGIDGKDMKYYKTSSNLPSHKEHSDNPDFGARLPVKIYIEADNKLYTDKGSDINAVGNFITGYYNSVATIYQNEYIPVEIAGISVWTNPDPYRFINSSYEYLLEFGAAKKDNFNGDLAQFLTTRPLGAGGIAWIGTLCSNYSPQDSSGRFSFCNIDPTYLAYPTYSWTVMVSTHELGHNFGSMHTHACWWPVNNANQQSAIDSCYYAEGNCFSDLEVAPAKGTIMSYCHLQANNGGGIDPRLGFGPLPGDTIRLRYNQCSKFGPVINSSEAPTNFALMQNYPNPFNPVTTIRFALPQNAAVTLRVYDISGREVARIIDGVVYNTGVYSVPFNAGSYSLASGVYLYRITALDASTKSAVFTEVKRMILIK